MCSPQGEQPGFTINSELLFQKLGTTKGVILLINHKVEEKSLAAPMPTVGITTGQVCIYVPIHMAV